MCHDLVRLICCFLMLNAWFGPAVPADDLHLEGHDGAVTMGRFGPQGRLAVTTCTDTIVRVWDAKTGSLIRSNAGHTGPVYCVDISADGRFAITGGQDNTARIWELPPSAANPLHQIDEHPVTKLAYLRDRLLALTSHGVSLFEANALSGDKVVQRPAIGSRLMTVHSNGTIFAHANQAGTVQFWSPFVPDIQHEVQTSSTNLLAIWFIGSELLTIDADGLINAWSIRTTTNDANKPTRPSVNVNQPGLKLQTAVPTINGSAIYAITADGHRVVVITTGNGQVSKEFSIADDTVQQIAVAPDGRLAVATATGRLKLFTNNSDQPVQTLEVAGVKAMAYSSDNLKLAVATDREVQILAPDAANSSQLTAHQSTPMTDTQTLVFAVDQRSVLAGSANGTISRIRYAPPSQVRQLSHSGSVLGLAITPDSQTAVACGIDPTIRVWNIETGQLKSQMRGHSGTVLAIALNPEGNIAISAGEDLTIRMWDIVGGRQLKQLTQTADTIYTLAVHPDGRHLVTAGADRTISVIDLESGDTVRKMADHPDFVHSVRFAKNGQRVVSYGYAGQLRFWDFGTGEIKGKAQVGRIGNFADVTADLSHLLIVSGDGTARIQAAP